MTIELKISRHAADKMLWLGITKEQVKEAIVKGAKFRQTEGHLSKFRYLNVAYKKTGLNVYKVKTVYVE
ncbi:hypothetical protein HYY74_05940 [Candidatus Woesearchaeota archaeon]|nr:hypothetical protein [Candidatus Woesearchaeota archaeon]